jgi:hypothetical protein
VRERDDPRLRGLARGVGQAQGLDEARERYRALAFQTLLVAVASLGLGSLTERAAILRTALARSVAAIDRLEFAESTGREWGLTFPGR